MQFLSNFHIFVPLESQRHIGTIPTYGEQDVRLRTDWTMATAVVLEGNSSASEGQELSPQISRSIESITCVMSTEGYSLSPQ